MNEQDDALLAMFETEEMVNSEQEMTEAENGKPNGKTDKGE